MKFKFANQKYRLQLSSSNEILFKTLSIKWVFIVFCFVCNAQIEFEQVLPSHPAPQIFSNFFEANVRHGSTAFSDVNGNGHEDVLIIGKTDFVTIGTIARLYINDGNGNFTKKENAPFTPVYRGSIAFSDIDGDGDQDVLISGMEHDLSISTRLYLNDGNGNFSEVNNTPFTGVCFGSIAFSDIDGDGDEDVLITGRNTTDEFVNELYTNDGSGNFTEVPNTSFEGVSLSSVAFADFDGDNDEDLLITGAINPYQSITKLYKNDGNGNFTEMLDTTFDGVSRGSIDVADIDNDGDNDIIIIGQNNSIQATAKLYNNDGNGNFTEVINTPFVEVTYGSVAFSDINNDSYVDILISGVINQDEPVTKLYTNDGNGNFSEVINTPFIELNGESVAFSDVDDNGSLDLLVTGVNSLNQSKAYLYVNDGNGDFTMVTGSTFANVSSSAIAFSDVNGDGYEDVLITGSTFFNYDPVSKLYNNDGNGNFIEVLNTPFDAVDRSAIKFADIDNDGDEDVLITGLNIQNERISKLYTNDGSGNFTEVIGTSLVGVIFGSVAFADIDNDGDQDLLITGRSIPEQGITILYLNDGNGNFTQVTGTPFENVEYSSIAFADIDNDGDQDVLITGFNTDFIAISKLYTNDGNGNFTELLNTPFVGVNLSSVAFADIDGDGYKDLLITGITDDYESTTNLYKNEGNGNFSEITETPFDDVGYSNIAFEDVDNDGHQDIIIAGKRNGFDPLDFITKLYRNDGNGNFTEVTGTPFVATSIGSIAFSDIDGNGYKDVLITGQDNLGIPTSNLFKNNTVSLGLLDNEKTQNFIIYPNPVSGNTITIFAPNKSGETQISLYDIIGNQVLNANYKFIAGKLNFDLGYLSKGIYFLKINHNKKNITRKIIVN